MNDKAIRKILISYIQTVCDEVRIYQEKSIGQAICDVMAVTDKLTGYEIKSDADNYERLERQIVFYDKFFDENYIVVSRRYLKSAEQKIPQYWGIICILDNSVEVKRKAKKNHKVSRRSQLSVLWKLELKNLLIKNNMPMFAQKEKGYISDRLSECVASDVLGEQIAHELLRRDYSVYDAKDYTTYSKKEVNIPVIDIVDTLSEENFEQFTLDQWIDLYKQAKEIKQKKEEVYKQTPVIRAEHEITYKDIEVSPGVPWISVDIIGEFVNYLIYGDEVDVYHNPVSYESVTGAWYIEYKNSKANSNINVKYGIPRYNALYILEATLNLREIRLYDSEGLLDEEDTAAALEKQKLIIDEFRSWVWRDEDRKWQIEEAYNRIFAKYKNKKYDGSKLVFPKMNENFSLFDYQKNAVERIISTKNTLLAFDVGAGKTYIMIAAAMKLREMGISKKNMFVVPNSIVGQWEKIFSDLYPEAKILAVEPKTFKPQMRQKVLEQIQKGDYDGIIIAYSCFELIPLSFSYLTDEMQKKVNVIQNAIQALHISRGYVAWGSTPLKREIEYIKKLTGDLMKSADTTPSGICFDDLEINTLFVDEAHNFKNIPIRTKLKRLRGINTNGSAKCLEMLQKVRCVQQQNNGRGVVFATGTPLCNSISDAYTMQMYLQYDELCEFRLDVFDNWVKTFAQPEQVCEIDITASNFRFVTRFARFFNLPELSKMFCGISVFHSMDNADGRPDCVGYEDVVINKYAALEKYMNKLCERSEAIRGGEVAPSEDNMLKVSTDGRKAALDLTLVGEEQSYDENSKIIRCIQKVIEVYESHPESSQLIFCDYSTPKGEDFSVYKEMKERLVEYGIPGKEIAFVHSYKSESTRLKMYEDVNKAKIRILIGSTFKLGIGANVQTKLKAIHHLDVPWRPADMTQREGRILRRGNENSEVMIFRYITKGSFDSYSWQLLETKQRFISQFLSGSSYQRSIEDLENNVLSYAEVKALALSSPIMKQLAEKENELRNLQMLCNKEAEIRRELKKRLEELDEEISQAKQGYNIALINAGAVQKISREKYLAAMKENRDLLCDEVIYGGEKELVSILGFTVTVPDNTDNDKPYVILKRSGGEYMVEMGESPEGNIRRITNFIKGFSKTAEKLKESLNKKLLEKQEVQRSLELPNEYIDKLRKCEFERDGLITILEQRNLMD